LRIDHAPESEDSSEPDYWQWISDAPPLLRDFGRRIAWADEAGQELHAAIVAFTELKPHTLHSIREGPSWSLTFVRLISERAENRAFERFARLIGAFLDNARASLNYLAVALVDHALEMDPSLADLFFPANRTSLKVRIEFPIFVNKEKYQREGLKKVQALPHPFPDLITSSQPFDDPESGLWLLHELAREFRHRVIHPVAVIPQAEFVDIRWPGTLQPDASYRFVAPGPWRDGNEVLTLTVAAMPDQLLDDVHPVVSISMGLDHPLCKGRDATGLLNSMMAETVKVAERFEPHFMI
jgi:hypothetical protein